MEFFERAHVVKNKSSKSIKLSVNKKKHLKQMLFGYRANDNKLIQKSTELIDDNEDSTSVSCYSDLNLTNSSYEDENATFLLNKDASSRIDIKDATPNSNTGDKIYEDSISGSDSYKSSEVSFDSARSDDSYDNESNEDKSVFSEESGSGRNSSMERSVESDFEAQDYVDETVLESATNTDTSMVMNGLNLSESDISEFDADRQLAAKIQEQLQLRINRQKHKDKYTIVMDEHDIAKATKINERGTNKQAVNKFSASETESSNQIKKNKQKHKDKYSIVLNKNDVRKGPVNNENCSTLQAETVCSMTQDESTRIKNNKQKHLDKYTILLDSNEIPKGPITKERCSVIQAEKLLQRNEEESKRIKKNKQNHKDKYTIFLDAKQNHIKHEFITALGDRNPLGPLNIEMREDDTSLNSNELNDEELNEDSDMSLPYISITASDMSTQTLDDIIGEYKHSTIKNLPSETITEFSTNNSGLFIEENMNVDEQIQDDVSSLIPEFDDIPKLEEIDDEAIKLDTTAESMGNNTIEPNTRTRENEKFLDYDQVAETFKVYYGTNCCIITLKHPSELFIQGKVTIRSLGGTVELFGYTLNKESCNIFAPYYNFAQGIKTVKNQNVYYGLFGKLTAAGLSVSEAEDIVTTMGENDGVILLQELESRAMDFVENNFRVTTMFKSNKTVEPYFSKASDILKCSLFSSRPYKSFNEHPSWREAIELAIIKQSRGIVCGGKDAGKSTYVRFQVNKLLANGPVLVVDLDPGQSLFTVAGNISATVVTAPLFGPSFTHLRKPEIRLNIGMINTMDNVKLYASAVRTLIGYCQNNKAFTDMPWIVNTMGMTNSLGLKFITLIITLLQPTYVLQYESQVVNQRFPTLLTPTSTKELFEDYKNDRLFKNVTYPEDLEYTFVIAHDTDSPHAGKSTFSLRPKDERYLNFLAYFSQLLSSREQSLLGITPYEVSLKDLSIATNVIIKKEHITKVLNGKLVALCQQTSELKRDGVFTLTDKPLACRGHGLIRGIDWEKEMLYVITPVPGEELGGVDTLLYADWMPELVWLERSLPEGTALPYRTSVEEQHKQLMSTPRRRFNNPLQFLKMAGGAATN